MVRKKLSSKKSYHEYRDINQCFDGILKKAKETERKVRQFKQFIRIRNSEAVLEDREVKAFGSFGAHVIIPKKFIGKRAIIIIGK